MTNLNEKLKYKNYKSLLSALKKSDSSLVKYKPFETLDYPTSIAIINEVMEFLPKAKQEMAQVLLGRYEGQIAQGIFDSSQKEPIKEIIFPKNIDKTDTKFLISLTKELQETGYQNKEDFSDIYMRFIKKLNKDKIMRAYKSFVNDKIKNDGDSSNFAQHKLMFVNVISQQEDIDLLHIDEIIYLYEIFSNYSFCYDYVKDRLNHFYELKNSLSK